MKEQNTEIIRVLKAFKTKNATYKLDEVCLVRPSLAKEFASRGLVEIVHVDEDEEKEEEVLVGPTWDDPELGQFHFDDFGWTICVAAPAFKAFKFRTRHRTAPATYKLVIRADTADQLPTSNAVALAKKVVTNQTALVAHVADALWADFTGTGPDSQMWWHGKLKEVGQGLETGKAPRSARDVLKLLKPAEIRIRQASRTGKIRVGKASRPGEQVVAVLHFAAAFEEEHGVGVITDGFNVLGIGYSEDVQPFKRPGSP